MTGAHSGRGPVSDPPRKKSSRRVIVFALPMLLMLLFALDTCSVTTRDILPIPHRFPLSPGRNMGALSVIIAFILDLAFIFMMLFLLLCEKFGARMTPRRTMLAGLTGVLAAAYFIASPPRLVHSVYVSGGPRCMVIGVGGNYSGRAVSRPVAPRAPATAAPAPAPSGPGV